MKANFMERFSVDEVLLIRILPNLPQLQNLAKAGYFFFFALRNEYDI